MHVLQTTEANMTSFQDFAFISDLLQEVKSNKGLTDTQYEEFLFTNGVYERPGYFLCYFQGDVPTSSSEIAKRAARAVG